MKFHLEITCDNAAFGDDPAHEVRRILEDLAESIEAHTYRPSINTGTPGNSVLDANGNTVGFWQWEK